MLPKWFIFGIFWSILSCHLAQVEHAPQNDGKSDYKVEERRKRAIGANPSADDFVKMYNKILQMEQRLEQFISKVDEVVKKSTEQDEIVWNVAEKMFLMEDRLDMANNTLSNEIEKIKALLQGKGDISSITKPAIPKPSPTTITASPRPKPSPPPTRPQTPAPERPKPGETVKFPPPGKDVFSVVCHYDTSASKGGGRFQPEDIDSKLCTDIIYDTAILDEDSLLVKPQYPELDLEKNFYKRVTGLKQHNPNLRVYLSLGGWVDSAGSKYSRLARDERKRTEFANHTVHFLKQYGFDGLDLAWMYPVCWQGNCNKGPQEDRLNYIRLLEALREAFDRQKPRMLLSAVVHAYSYAINRIYHVPSMIELLDRIEVKTYGYKYSSDDKTSHLAPLHNYNIGSTRMVSVTDSINYWLKLHVPSKKLFVTIPGYGKIYTLANPNVNGLGAPAVGTPLHINYNHICEKLKQPGWTVVDDIAAGTYAYKGKEWIGYVGPTDVAKVAKFVQQKNLGGAALWDITDDDYNTFCCSTRYPLLTMLNMILRSVERSRLKDLGCPDYQKGADLV